MSEFRFEILQNFPQEFLDEAKQYWEEKKDTLKSREWYGQRKVGDVTTKRMMKDFYLDSPYLIEKFKEIFDSPLLLPDTIGFLFAPANSGHFIHHYDKQRSGCINMPVCVDHENSMFFTGENNEEMSDQDWEDVYWGKREYQFQPENYKFYNLRRPIVFEAKRPHSIANWADTDRILLTANFDCSGEELRNALPPEWF